jgi:hypothetical protein
MPKNKNLSKITSYLTADTDNGILSSNVSQIITGSLTVTGNLTAQQFIVSSSVTYLTQSFASGSHKFGNSSDDTHQFTGSVFMSNSLGIGTNSPNFNNFGTALTLVANSGYAGVEVYGSGSLNGGQIDFGSGNIRYASISGEYESSTNGFLKIRTRKAGTMTDVVQITSAGNVGIGTTSPGNRLAILGPDETVNPTLGTNAGKFGIFNGVGSGTYGMIMGVINNGNSYLQVQRIDTTATAYNLLLQPSGGNVGIGIATSNPGYKLEVSGTGYFSSTLSAGGTISGGNVSTSGTLTGAYLSVGSTVYTYNVVQGYYGQNYAFTPPNALNSGSDNSSMRMYMVWVWGVNGYTEAGCKVWMIAMNGGGTAYTANEILGRDANGGTSLSISRSSASQITISSNNNAFIKYVSIMQLMTFANG